MTEGQGLPHLGPVTFKLDSLGSGVAPRGQLNTVSLKAEAAHGAHPLSFPIRAMNDQVGSVGVAVKMGWTRVG